MASYKWEGKEVDNVKDGFSHVESTQEWFSNDGGTFGS
jgi:hypothetical protein